MRGLEGMVCKYMCTVSGGYLYLPCTSYPAKSNNYGGMSSILHGRIRSGEGGEG